MGVALLCGCCTVMFFGFCGGVLSVQFCVMSSGNNRFILSDGGVNEYGFRLLSEGWNDGEFRKTPIGFLNHDKSNGALVRWNDIQLNDGVISAIPVLNEKHPDYERAAHELKNGFITGASVGGLKFNRTSLDLSDSDNPVIVVHEWSNKEASLVYLPGNRNALKVELADGAEEDIKSVFKRLLKEHNNMKKIELEITPQLLETMELSDAGALTGAAIIEKLQTQKAAVEGLTAKNTELDARVTTLTTELNDAREKSLTEQIDGILKKGLDEGRLTAKACEHLKIAFRGNPKGLSDVVDSMKPFKSVVDNLDQAAGDLPKELQDKTFSELDKMEKTAELKAKYPEAYKRLFKQQFGVEPNM